ncbi:MAG: metallophosphoesterase [Candidatus Micrarchaeota archaeon]
MPLETLFISDCHGEQSCIPRLEKLAEARQPRLAVFTGDLTTRGDTRFPQEMFSLLERRGCRIFAVGGNLDPKPLHEWLEQAGYSIHARRVAFKGFTIAGLGGSLKTPFGTCVEYSEGQFAGMLEGLLDEKTIFATHNPPFNTVADRVTSGAHVGSHAIREAIERHHPRACLCGHIHEAQGSEKLGSTLLVKLPPFKDGGAVAMDLKTLEFKFLTT